MLKQCDMTDEARVFFDKIPEDKLITAQFMFLGNRVFCAKMRVFDNSICNGWVITGIGERFFPKNI